MRILLCATALVCVASPAFSGILTPTVNGVVVSNYDADDPRLTSDTGDKCLLDPVDATAWEGGWEASFGDLSGDPIVPEARAVYEFGHGLSRKIHKATLDFKAKSLNGGASLVCVNAYVGDGSITVDDYLPSGAVTVATFDLWDNDEYGMFLSGTLDITDILNDLIVGGYQFLGIQLASGNNVDSYNRVEYITISIEVPEPAVLALFGFGLVGLGARQQRKPPQA